MTELVQNDPSLERYARQFRYARLGEEGQRGLSAARVLVCGCGALGSVVADILARAGIGHLRLVDRDYLELHNLQRQVLYSEADVASGLPKAAIAASKLRDINSAIEIEPVVADVTASNIAHLCSGVDVIVDGTDNFETRYLLNEAAQKFNIPWVYGGAIGASGQTMTILPGETACLRCVLPEAPPPGSMPNCDTAGILASAAHVVASLEALEAIKIASGNRAAINRRLTVIDLWDNQFRQVGLEKLAQQGCPTCRQGDYPWLAGRLGSQSAVLCGRNAVQLAPATGQISLDALAEKLSGVGTISRNPFLLRLAVGDFKLSIFPDGRAIIAGTDDVAVARSLYARYIGM
jgi:molybdopterin-synthase adenylyltransferase